MLKRLDLERRPPTPTTLEGASDDLCAASSSTFPPTSRETCSLLGAEAATLMDGRRTARVFTESATEDECKGACSGNVAVRATKLM